LRGEGGSICKTAASRKRKRERDLKGNDAMKVTWLARGQDNCHSHACILAECGMFCTPTLLVRAGKNDTPRIRHGCRVAQKTISGFSEHMCRNCQWTVTCMWYKSGMDVSSELMVQIEQKMGYGELQQRMHIKIHVYLYVYLPIANLLD